MMGWPLGAAAAVVLELAAVAEKHSEHPLARAVLAHAKAQGLAVADPEEFKVEIGRGVVARWKGQDIAVGKEDFVQGNGVTLSAAAQKSVSSQTEQGRTAVLVARGNEAVGLIAIADEVRPETRQAIGWLYQVMGNRNITMLTGDNPLVAGAVARQIGVENFRAGLLPEHRDCQRFRSS